MPISKRPQWLAFLASLISVFVFFAGTAALAVWSRSLVLGAAVVPFGLMSLFSLVALWYAFLTRREQEETQAQSEIAANYEREDLFESDESLRLAANARNVFLKFFITSFTVLAGVVVAFSAGRYFLTLAGAPSPLRPVDPLGIAGVSAFMVLFTMLTGSYFVGVSRQAGCRWLRPVGSWAMFGGFVYVLAVIAMLAKNFEFGLWDTGLARLVYALLFVFGVEMVLNFILEFYRPRVKDEVLKPLYESRFLAFVTEPGGIARNVAYSLDYQFGFKVSETWFYRFIEKSVVPLVLVMVIAMYLLDCFVMIDAHQQGLRETYLLGVPMKPQILQPGLCFKLPRPLQVIRKYDVAGVHEVNIGFEHGADGDTHGQQPPGGPEEMQGDPSGRVIVWNKSHFKSEDKFIVASRSTHGGENSISNLRDTLGETATGPASDTPARKSQAVPVSFIGTTLQVSYRVRQDGLMAYAYNYKYPERTLKDICQAELVRYLVSHDLFDILGAGMTPAEDSLNTSIREAVKAQQPDLGVDIVFVGFAGVHPPAEVGESFQKVVGAQEERESKILRAETYSNERVNVALGQYKRTVADAEGERALTVKGAEGEREQFLTQMSAFEQSPGVFMLRKRLDMLEEKAKGVRKYLIASDSKEIIILNLEEKLRPDLLKDLEIGDESN